MSSPNHPTFDIEDAFSSTYSPDYTSASSGNTPSKSLNDSYGLVPIASPTLSLFHNDVYMKVMHAYDAIIPPMPPKRTSTSAAPAMNQAAIQQLINNRVAASLEAQAANMENTDNTNRNPEPIEALIARKCSYKDFMSCQPFNFKECKVKFTTGTLTKEALSGWNSFAQPIGIEKAYKLSLVEFKKLLIKNFYRGLPQIIKGNVTASKPQTLEEAINITQRLIDQVTKHNSVQGTNDHKQKFDDSKNTTDDNNYYITVTTTIITITMTTTNSRIEGKKPSELMLSTKLSTVGMLETFPCVEDVLQCCVSSLQQGGPPDQVLQKQRTSISKHHSIIQLNLSTRFLLREGDYNNP
uniref:Reverse transcriptase domain-containing protein n=1 Tax=Tanacetum cinerariifolium TaxID=118510 RepID=A0A6L2JBI9_TANCI|nr:hypothetical protein [Tanacetum cinerariifolium]